MTAKNDDTLTQRGVIDSFLKSMRETQHCRNRTAYTSMHYLKPVTLICGGRSLPEGERDASFHKEGKGTAVAISE